MPLFYYLVWFFKIELTTSFEPGTLTRCWRMQKYLSQSHHPWREKKTQIPMPNEEHSRGLPHVTMWHKDTHRRGMASFQDSKRLHRDISQLDPRKDRTSVNKGWQSWMAWLYVDRSQGILHITHKNNCQMDQTEKRKTLYGYNHKALSRKYGCKRHWVGISI